MKERMMVVAALAALAAGQPPPTADFMLTGLLEEYADVRANRKLTSLVEGLALRRSLASLLDQANQFGITSLQVLTRELGR